MTHEETISKIAEIILNELNWLDDPIEPRTPVSGDVFAYQVDTLANGNKAIANLTDSQTDVYLHQVDLKQRPFVAYVRSLLNEQEKHFFIRRGHTPLGHLPKTPASDFVNYLSPMGRIIEMNPGDDDVIVVPGGENYVELLEKNLFTAQQKKNEWDGIDNEIYFEADTYSIESLALFLDTHKKFKEEISKYSPEQIKKLEEELKTELAKRIRIRKGRFRKIVEKVALRDQPTLDKNQGDIFRLPLFSKLIITGAPGTGKTTLLIKRIAQKSDPNNLEPDELAGLDGQQIQDFFHQKNWLLFSPTELLKIFLKEAFAQEWLPASDQLVKVWDDERTVIAREILNFLKVGDKGYFRKTGQRLLTIDRNAELINYANKFANFFYNSIIKEFEQLESVHHIQSISPKLISGFSRTHDLLEKSKIVLLEDKVLYIIEELNKYRSSSQELRRRVNEELEKIVNKAITNDSNLIEKIHKLMNKFKKEAEDFVSVDDEEVDDEFEAMETETEWIVLAKRQLKRTVRLSALNAYRERAFSHKSIHHEVGNELRIYMPSEDRLKDLGGILAESTLIRRLTQGHRMMLSRVPQIYQKFRAALLKDSSDFFDPAFHDVIRKRSLENHEVDLLIFTMLKHAWMIMKKNPELLERNTKIDILENIKNKYATLVVVDEATDFSSIQLGCMYYLAHPRYSSFSVAGDLMQRVTGHGIKDWKECDFITRKFDLNNVNTVYRQSARLLHIAEILYEQSVGQEAPFASAFEVDEDDPFPLKLCSNGDRDVLGQWIADRVVDIYNINKKLPSVAIFVADDGEIDDMVECISEPLEENAIGVKGCHRGEILGSEGKVRVFSVQYIKGLEFECVFFANIDDIFIKAPDMIDKYLYVGLSRAASFLAITYKEKFPEKIQFVENLFKEGNWII